MALDIGKLAQDTSNADILDAVRGIASTDYQRRIQSTTAAGVKNTIENLMDPDNRQWQNEFIDVLVNRIGMVIARSNSWTNPLSPFKRGMLTFGNTIEEVQVGLLKAHGYDPDRDYMEQTLFGRERPEVQANFHTVNRMDFYKVTINDVLLRRAFLDEGGLSSFVTQLMQAPTNSDQWDEFLLTASLFREYEANGGFYHVNVPDVSAMESNEGDAKRALRKMRAMAENMQFMSTEYNAARMPVFANRDELQLFVTPEFNAAIDVEALAGAFNVDRASMYGKIVPLPASAIGIDGAQAILTTSDFFVIADTLFESTNQWNPASLHNNYFLHHHQVISASRFVPAVMFHTGADDEVIKISPVAASVSPITIEPIDGEAVTDTTAGGIIQLLARTLTTPELSGEDMAAEAVQWSVSGNESAQTFVTQQGVLHVGDAETATSVTVTASSVLVDAKNPRADAKTATLDVDITGGPLIQWPEQGFGPVGFTIAGVDVAGVTAADTSYDVVVPAGTSVTKNKVEVNTNGSADVDVSVAKVGETGYTVTIAVDNGKGAPVVYTVNVTFD